MACHVDCADVMRQLFDFLDEELTAERMIAIRAHLDRCSKCYPNYNFEKLFLEAVAATRTQSPAPAALRTRIVSALREAGFTPG